MPCDRVALKDIAHPRAPRRTHRIAPCAPWTAPLSRWKLLNWSAKKQRGAIRGANASIVTAALNERETGVSQYTEGCGGMQWSPRSILSLFSNDLAIDLGTANTLVYVRGKGIVVCEPSIIAVNQTTGKVEAVGKDAKEMLGRTPGNIIAIRPMKDGVIADFEITEKMLSHFIRKAHNRNTMVRPRIIIGIPSEVTQVEKRAVKDSALKAKA